MAPAEAVIWCVSIAKSALIVWLSACGFKCIRENGPLGNAVYDYIGHMVSVIGGDAKCLAGTMVHTGASYRGDVAVCTSDRRNDVGIDSEAGINGVIGSHLTKRIGGNRTLGQAIHYYIDHMIAGFR